MISRVRALFCSTFIRGLVRHLLDYVTRRFNASSAGLKSSWGCTFAETTLNAISRSNWNSESAEVGPLFKVPRKDGSRFRAELDCS
jgi:hypothetical protein